MDYLRILNSFKKLFHSSPVLFVSPGRINLIGEHTDYNEGFVLPAAIDKEAVFAVAANPHHQFRFFASDLHEHFETGKIEMAPKKFHWTNYLLGVLAQFEKEGVNLPGFDCVFGSDIPVGAGLSSSAAIECGFTYAIDTLLRTDFPKHKLALMAQKAEHEYAGVMCGIMDQFASVFGEKDHVIRLDCRDNSHKYFPFKTDEYSIVLCDTGMKHSLASSEYNIRRKECETGVATLKRIDPQINSLRDTTIDVLNENRNSFDQVVFKRCKYVVEENERVIQACDFLLENNLKGLGKLMYQSHHGLKNEYEVSCDELDTLVEASLDLDYVAGARMMGGGFGGCTINLVETEQLEIFKTEMISYYRQKTGRDLPLYVVKISRGTKLIS